MFAAEREIISELADQLKNIQERVYTMADGIESHDFGQDRDSLLGSTRGIIALATIAAIVAAGDSLLKPIDEFEALVTRKG